MKILNHNEMLAVSGSSHTTWVPGYYTDQCDIFGCYSTYTDGHYREVSDAEEVLDVVLVTLFTAVFIGILAAAVTANAR